MVGGIPGFPGVEVAISGWSVLPGMSVKVTRGVAEDKPVSGVVVGKFVPD
jgi:hypothetical protein